MIDPRLLAILGCPEDKGPLLYVPERNALYNPRLRRRYVVVDDVPVLLIDEGVAVGEAEHAALMAKGPENMPENIPGAG